MIDKVDFILESYGLSDFLFYKIEDDNNLNLDNFNLIRSTLAPSLLPIQIISKKDNRYIRYDLISENNISSILKNGSNKKSIVWILSNLIEIISEIERLNLNIDNIVLNSDYIFIDNFTKKLLIIYMPIKENNLKTIEFRKFIKDVILKYPYDENEDLVFFIKIFNYLVKNEEFIFNDFKEFFNSIIDNNFNNIDVNNICEGEEESLLKKENDKEENEDEGETISCQYSSKKSTNKIEIEEEVQYKRVTRTEFDDKNKLDEGSTAVKPATINIIPNSNNSISIVMENTENGTVYLNEDEELELGTVALEVNNLPNKAYLLLVNKNEKAFIDKNIFKLGRDASIVDLAILNKAVGREHGEIIVKGDEYYFRDNNSTNGSYINGSKVMPDIEYKIGHKDIIKLANEQIIFKLY